MDIDFNDINSFGCVVLADDIPHLFIMDGDDLLEGIPLFDDSDLYTTLNLNEMIIVGVVVKDSDGENIIDVNMIDDDNYDELVYVVTPLKFYTLKTKGLIIDDIMDLEFFDVLVKSLIDEYLENLNILK